MTTAVVFAGGPYLSDPAGRWLRRLRNPIVVAADSGYDRARADGFEVDVLIGDLDSISEPGLLHAQEMGIEIFRLPVDKDQTDFEAALHHASRLPISELVLVASMTGRVDHALAVMAAIGAPWGVPVRAVIDEALGWVVRDGVRVALPVGTTVSLIPMGGDVTGVTTSGLSYPLRDDTLRWTETRGVSNEVASSQVSVSVRDGALLLLYEGLEI